MMGGFWKLAAKTGLVSDGSQPPYGCAWPLKVLSDIKEADALTDEHFEQAMALVNDKEWEIVAFKDPEEGGDMHLWSKPQIGRYHHVKITMSLQNTDPQSVIDFALSEDLSTRKEFSADIQKLEVLAKTEKTSLQHQVFSAPSPVAGRDFVFLCAQKELEGGAIIAYGCSVDSPKVPEESVPVRGATLFAWHVTPVGDHVMVNYVNCFDPRGWTPSFLLAWLKSAATQEFVNIRAVLSGKKAKVEQLKLEECGVSKDELKAELEQAKTA